MTIKTTLHAYRFDVRNPDEKAAYADLKAKLKAMGLECFETHGGGSHYLPALDGIEIELETAHLFNNQWNTAPIEGVSDKGLRVFDWAQDFESSIGAPRGIKRGHWLEQTPEMQEIRRNTDTCGYCGKQEPAAKGYVFCPHCLGSEYLKASDLHLTRMLPVDKSGVSAKRAPLTEAERDHLLPLYREAQLHGNTDRDKTRIAKRRADVESKYRQSVDNATRERAGMLWLMDRGIKTDNAIYYSHTRKFSFGWRQPIDSEMLSDLLDVISEFPFAYEIKTADGRTLEGYEEESESA